MTREVETGAPVIDQFPAFEDDGISKRSGLLPGDFSSKVYRDGAVVALPVTITPATGDPGEYKTVFTPSADGFYELHVHIIFSGDIRFARYESVSELTRDIAAGARSQAQKLDLLATTWPPTIGSVLDRLANKDASQTYDRSLHSLEAIAGAIAAGNVSIGVELGAIKTDLTRVLGLLHRNAILDEQVYDGNSQLTFARLRVFDSPANVPTMPGGNETVGLLHKYEIETEYDGVNIVRKFTLKQIL